MDRETCPTCGQTNSRQGMLSNVYFRHGRLYGLPERHVPVIDHKSVMVQSYVYEDWKRAEMVMIPRTVKVYGRGERTNVRIRLGRSQYRTIRGRRPWAVCPDLFHQQVPVWRTPPSQPTPQLPKRVHHPDLQEQKKSLKRALQGKDRR